ncbi:MAG: hypothetical protein QXJ27_07695 [Thermoplasmata archaeon]
MLGGLSVVASGEENRSESLQALIEIKKYIEAQESSVFASDNAKVFLLEHLSIAIKFAENGERGKALKEYNRNVYAWFDNYIVDDRAREVLERMTEAYYGTLDVSQSGSGNLGILASTYPQITAATFTNDWNQAYNDSRRVVNFTVNWGGSTDGDAIVYWNSTWNKTAPTQWPGSSGYLGFSYAYQYTLTNLPVGNFTNIRIRAFDYQYGGIATKDAKVHNTEVYDKRIALIICGWGKNQAGYWSFWNDANFTYWTLRSKGFSDDDIYFLYCNGTHLGYTNYYGTIIDGNATRARIDSTCSTINGSSTNNSLVFVMVTTHGNVAPNGTAFFAITLNENNTGNSTTRSSEVWSTEFGRNDTFIGKISNFKRMVICVECCYSGKFIYTLKNMSYSKQSIVKKSIVITSTSDCEEAYPTWNLEYSAFYYYFIAGLRGSGTVSTRNGPIPVQSEDPTDKDTVVSLVEAWNWSTPIIPGNTSNPQAYQQPHYADLDSSSNNTTLPLPLNETGPSTMVGLGSRGLGVSLDPSPYPLYLLRSDT